MSIAKRLAAAALAAIALAAAQTASALTVGFSFTNSPFYGGGVVSGVIEGLADNETRAATSLRVTSNTGPGNFGIGEYVGTPNPNSFTLVNGVVTFADFRSFGGDNVSPAVTTASLGFIFKDFVAAGLGNDPDFIVPNGDSGLTFSIVPLPPAILMLASGVGALAGLGVFVRRGAAS